MLGGVWLGRWARLISGKWGGGAAQFCTIGEFPGISKLRRNKQEPKLNPTVPNLVAGGKTSWENLHTRTHTRAHTHKNKYNYMTDCQMSMCLHDRQCNKQTVRVVLHLPKLVRCICSDERGDRLWKWCLLKKKSIEITINQAKSMNIERI